MGIFGKIFLALEKRERRPFCTAVIVAAGSSSRMSGENKILMKLCGKSVVIRAAEPFQASGYIDEIVVVAREEDVSEIAGLCAENGLTKVSKVICGGEKRLDSALIGALEASPKAKLIAVHDGARPLVTCGIVDAAVKAAAHFPAAAPAVRVNDTLKVAKNGIVEKTLDRSSIYAVQTPQVFSADILKAALQNAAAKGLDVTDDCSAAEAMGVSVRLTAGSYENIKLTTPADVVCAEAVIRAREEKTAE